MAATRELATSNTGLTLNEALDEVQVEDRAAHDPTTIQWWPAGLPWGVSLSNEGVIALFMTEEAANHYRLTLVAQLCNSGWQHPLPG